MQLSPTTIRQLVHVITGDRVRDNDENSAISPYRSGPDIVNFFNNLGWNEIYDGEFGTRWRWAESKLLEVNGNKKLEQVICSAFDPRVFLRSDFKIEDAVDYLNEFLVFDDYKLVSAAKGYRVVRVTFSGVAAQSPYGESKSLNHLFIQDQIHTCEARIAADDFDGAITAARSLLEAVLKSIEVELSGKSEPYSGDLMKLFKRVQKLMNLDPSQEGISQTLKQILSGISSIVAGVASLRNKMGDAHAISYRPSRHHAVLAVNAVNTISNFLFDSLEYQRERHLEN
ncbi:MAG: abortive infection family protein [Planctomycetota bacterium]